MFKRKKYHLPKFEAPQVSGLHTRSRLFNLLDGYDDKRVLWLSAPAGTGKTSLLASYFANNQKKLLWYQIDAGDEDIASFFHHMAFCIKNAYPKKRGILPNFTSEHQAGLPAFSVNYFRALFQKIDPGSVVVLDNYQDAGGNTNLHEALQHFANEVPLHVQLIIVSRIDPPALLSNLQASNQFALISFSEIQFTRPESDQIATMRSKITLSDLQCKQLHDLTNGWAAGLTLTLAHCEAVPDFLSHQKFSDRNALFDYVANEIFNHFDSETQSFLLKTSFLKRISLSVAKKLTNEPRTKQILRNLSSHQLLTMQHDHMDESFEYHPLFREFLYQQATRNYSKTVLNTLHKKAGTLLLKKGEIVMAAEQFVANKNWAVLTDLINNHAKNLIQTGLYKTIERWLMIMPKQYVDGNNWLCYWRAASQLQYDPIGARKDLEIAHHRFIKSVDSKGAYLSYCNIIESYIQAWDTFKPLQDWIHHRNKLKNILPSIPGIELRIRVHIAIMSAMVFVDPAHKNLSSHVRIVETAFRFIPVKQLKAMLGSLLGQYYIMSGQIEKQVQITHSIQPLLDADEVSYLAKIMILNSIGIANIYIGTTDEQDKIWHQGLTLVEDTGITSFNRIFLTHMTNTHLVRDDSSSAEKILNDIDNMGIGANEIFRGYYYFLRGRVELVKAEYQPAITFFTQSINIGTANGFVNGIGLSYLFLSLAYAEIGEYEQAHDALQEGHSALSQYGTDSGNCLNNFGYESFHAYLNLLQGKNDQAKIHLRRAIEPVKTSCIYSTVFWYSRLFKSLTAFALENNIEPEYTRKFIIHNRLTPPDDKRHLESWPWPVKIYTLGRFTISINGQVINADSRPTELLKVLLAFGGRDVAEEKIIDVLWPDTDGDQAQTNFKTTLHRLRKSFGDIDALLLKHHRLSVNGQYCWVDNWKLSNTFYKAQTAKKTSDPEQEINLVTSILDTYTEHFLSKETTSWSIPLREKLRSQYVRHVMDLSESIEVHNAEIAIISYQRLLEMEPLTELAYQRLIQTYDKQGRRAEATATYQQCKRMLQSAGMTPSRQTKTLLD